MSVAQHPVSPGLVAELNHAGGLTSRPVRVADAVLPETTAIVEQTR